MTAQIPELILVDDEQLAFSSLVLPLNPVLATRRIDLQSWHSANWRGYTGFWVLRDSRLWLERLDGAHDRDGKPVTLNDVFPDRDPPILADWFSGKITAQFGKLLEYRHVGFASTYEFERTLTFSAGKLRGDATKRNTFEEKQARRQALLDELARIRKRKSE